MNSKMSWEERT